MQLVSICYKKFLQNILLFRWLILTQWTSKMIGILHHIFQQQKLKASHFWNQSRFGKKSLTTKKHRSVSYPLFWKRRGYMKQLLKLFFFMITGLLESFKEHLGCFSNTWFLATKQELTHNWSDSRFYAKKSPKLTRFNSNGFLFVVYLKEDLF